MHRTPVSGKYMYDYGPKKTCLDDNLLLLHLFWLCVSDGLCQQCGVPASDFALLKKASNVLVQWDNEVVWTRA